MRWYDAAMCNKLLAVALLSLFGCKPCSPEAHLRKKARPEPITCVSVSGSTNAKTCTDGAGVVWSCDTSDCVATGTVPRESK